MTWADAWSILNAEGKLVERPNQRTLAEAVFENVTNGGTLIGEAPVGVGKSFAACIPLIYAIKAGTDVRAVYSTETTALQDQLVDKDLPALLAKFGGFSFRSLKGRSWYLCHNKAGAGNPLTVPLRDRNIGNGERRDVEAYLKRKLTEDEWSEISGESEFCSSNKCKPEVCYSTRARNLAQDADLVVTNHSLLRTHAELEDGLLGTFQHLVVDEAHTLEKVLIDGWAEELSPYLLYKGMDAIWEAINATSLQTTHAGKVDEAQRLMQEGVNSIIKLFRLLAARRDSVPGVDDDIWRRENFPLSEQYLSGSITPTLVAALEDYELQGPGRFRVAADVLTDVQEQIEKEMTTLANNGQSIKKKIRKGRTAARNISRVMDMLSESVTTRDAIVMRYGVPYAVIGQGHKAWKGDPEVGVRCIPLDVSTRAYDSLWKNLKSITLMSGTLRDETDGSFRYVIDSLGVKDAKTLVVGTSFDYAKNQLIYLTPGFDDSYMLDVKGAKFSFDELVAVISATKGRALVLFTANAELEQAAYELRGLQASGAFPHQILVQERGVSKQDLVDAFVADSGSVLLGSKSFFTGVNFPGETCSAVILAKFPLPQFNSLCRAQIAWWRKRSHPKWYEREALQIFKQANGRLIRNETDRGVIAILDRRVADAKERVCDLTRIELTATGSAFTNDINEMEKWLNA